MDRLRIGTAGIPLRAKGKGVLEGLRAVKELGLDAMELEFVRGVWLKDDTASTVGMLAKKLDILLTAHAPYYINFFNEKHFEKSLEHLWRSVKALGLAGGWSVVFHAGYKARLGKEEHLDVLRRALKMLEEKMATYSFDLWVRPETMGKHAQWGELDEILRLSQEFEFVAPCVDFAHIHARYGGKFNSAEEWSTLLEKIEQVLGKAGLESMHIHVSGIIYGSKGERKHIPLRESDLRYEELVEVWKAFGVKGVAISESPNIEEDALLVKTLMHQP